MRNSAGLMNRRLPDFKYGFVVFLINSLVNNPAVMRYSCVKILYSKRYLSVCKCSVSLNLGCLELYGL
jgi:hypothetical protein